MNRAALLVTSDGEVAQHLEAAFAARDWLTHVRREDGGAGDGDPAGEPPEAAIARTVAEVEAGSGGVGAFVWASLLPSPDRFGTIEPAAYEAYMERAVHSAFFYARACVRAMERRRNGRLLFVTSTAATLGDPDLLYTLASGCLNTLAKSLAKEEARKGITANALSLGVVEGWAATALPTVAAFHEQYFPFRQPLRLVDVAHTVAELATDEASRVNGQIINMDGGTL
jgi:NAD(P)-dependent dehydrogenase (short-subunit alcohol dehydrogenase family)